MKMISIQEAYQRYFKRQAGVPELELHASGHCAHIGKISPACLQCFIPCSFHRNFPVSYFKLGDNAGVCQLDCPYCTDDKSKRYTGAVKNDYRMSDEDKEWLLNHCLSTIGDDPLPCLSFSGSGEPTLHFDVITEFMKFLKGTVEPQLPDIPWYKLYTNGLLMNEDNAKMCSDIGIDEIRFHLGASNFSEVVYRNMEVTVKHIDTVVVETPRWPPHKKMLFEMLPRIEEIGVKHLNLTQIEVTPWNMNAIIDACPDAEFYQVQQITMDDGGMVYDIMKEVLKRGYSYSVLDCSAFVKQIQRSRDSGVPTKSILWDDDDVENMVDVEKWRKKQRG